MSDKTSSRIKYIWIFGRKYIPTFLLAGLCIMVSYTVSVLLPLNLRRLTDDVLYSGQYELLPIVIRDYCLLFIISTIFNFLYAFVWQYLNNHFVLDIKNELFKKIVYSKASFLSGINSGDLMTRIDGDSDQFIYVVQRNLFHFIYSMIMCVGIVIVVAKINYIIAIILIMAAILPIVITRISGKITEKYANESRQISGDWIGKIYETLKGFREIKVHNASSWAEKLIILPFKRLLVLGNKSRRVGFVVGKGIEIVNLISTLAIYAVSAQFVVRGELTIGLFLAVIQYISLLHRKFNWILRIWLDWYSRKTSIDRVAEILDLESESYGSEEIKRVDCIEFKNVEFEYNAGSPVLKNINFKISLGEKVGIVGHSGNGKSTIVSLLLGFYPVKNGDIIVNGFPLSDINQIQLRKNIGIVSQDIVLFEDTIRYNLNLGENYSEDKIYKALKTVELLETIEALPRKIDTIISPVSHNLSGGQKQRLMIARMLLRNPQFIIMDEATSALDVETERLISDAVNALLPESTKIIISHRFETIRECDKIIVLNNHEVEAIGTCDQLMRNSTSFKMLFGRESP